MSIAPYIKEIGRGKEGARSLTQAQAYDLMSQMLDGHVSDLEVGAFCIAMRIKGETTVELAGFLEAAQERCLPITHSLHPDSPVVLLPSYNGARKLPNLTALLALLLAQKGVPVLVHGVSKDAGRVTTADVFHDLGLPIAQNTADIGHAWSRREPVFMAIDTLCPTLSKLLDVRRVIGLRNPGHTVAKLLDPTRGGAALRVVNHTHPEYAEALSGFLQHTQANALLMRGTEGEPVADARRLPRLDIFVRGTLQSALSRPAKEGVLTELPLLPRSIDAATTAVYIQSVVSGEAPAPLPITQQVDCLIQSLKAMST
jgi:anthranilate phosphoribosyltransferase